MEQKQKLLYIGIGFIGIVGFLVGAYFLMNDPSYAFKSSGEKPSLEITKTVQEHDHTSWSNKNNIILTEYSDIQCPACATAHTALNQIKNGTDKETQKIKEHVTFIYRHYPLTNIHPKAFDAAIAAEAAAKQGKFYEMLDLLYEKQAEWSGKDTYQDTFIEYATALKIDTKQFKKDMQSEAILNKVNKDIETGESVQINATPTFFLNGEKMEYRTYEEFKKQLLDSITEG